MEAAPAHQFGNDITVVIRYWHGTELAINHSSSRRSKGFLRQQSWNNSPDGQAVLSSRPAPTRPSATQPQKPNQDKMPRRPFPGNRGCPLHDGSWEEPPDLQGDEPDGQCWTPSLRRNHSPRRNDQLPLRLRLSAR